jgi:hypothetical protein
MLAANGVREAARRSHSEGKCEVRGWIHTVLVQLRGRNDPLLVKNDGGRRGQECHI